VRSHTRIHPRRTQVENERAIPARPPAWTYAALYASIVTALLIIYQPAIRGGLLWDDPAHLTRPELKSVHGLWRIWFDPGATQQYYPVVHSAFWLMSHVFGDVTLGYHLVNIFLHALSAVLIAVILRTLGVRGAYCTAVLFAVHPVQVESVAWMTELKNTLSGVFYLASLGMYLRFDETRQASARNISLLLFVLAILTKSVTATLPVVLVVLFWLRRGRVDLRRDVRPLALFFGLGAVMGLVTALMERNYIGATGHAFDLTIIDRCLLAGRVVWFYLWKIFWPTPLTFIYPRWDVNSRVWWQYLFPLALLAAFVLLWRLRRWSRAPFAALLMFVVTLAPALGFVNVYPFKFSYVADHFQYLAMVPMLAFAVGAVFWLVEGRLSTVVTSAVVVAAIGGPLSLLAWASSREYSDASTLYRATIAKNPHAWLAYNNLAMLDLEGNPGPEEFKRALANFDRALALAPADSTVQFNVGTALYRLERLDEALPYLRAAVEADPDYADAWANLGATQQKLDQLPDALESDRKALSLKPDLAWVHYNASAVFLELGRLDEAAEIVAGTETTPASAPHRFTLGKLFTAEGQYARAVDQYQRAVHVAQLPNEALDDFGYALLQLGRAAEAERYLRMAIAQDPDDPAAHSNLGNALQQQGRMEEALAAYRQALAVPGGAARPESHNDYGVALARAGRMAEAIAQFHEAVRLDPGYQAAQQNLAKAMQSK
jgi:tetratricopeptide (TPR) repeat protein